MKARLICQETVYLYHIGLNSQRGQEITQALGEISVQVKEIKEEQLGETLGYCLGLPGFSKNDSPLAEEGFDQEVLVMKGFTRQSMDRMLKQFQRKGVPPVALKAVLTEHNSKWRCIDFFRELEREHMFMSAYQSLRRQVLVAEGIAAPSQDLRREALRASELLAKGNEIEYEELVQELKCISSILEKEGREEK